MLYRSQDITAASGSIGGTTFSHNRGGLYRRARVTPVNPSTPAQGIVRTLMALLTNRWSNILTQVQRDAWDVYALNTPLPDPFGEPRNVGGLGMFIRGNLPAQRAGLPLISDGPPIFDVGEFTPIAGLSAAAATDTLIFSFTPADAWANEDDAAMLVYSSRPQNQAINYFTGPYRFAGSILGDGTTPPTSPASITGAFPFSAGQRVFWRVQVIRADGRYSTTQRVTAIAA